MLCHEMRLYPKWDSVPYGSWYRRYVATQNTPRDDSLRERKMRRTRDTIVDAALALFAERGFDGATVADIAERAEVGRSTFFRYFTDKREVLFADDADSRTALVEASTATAAGLAPLGDRLTDALLVARSGLLALARRIESSATPAQLALRARLVSAHPELRARDLAKQDAYGVVGTRVMLQHGATPGTAALAVRLAFACYHAAALATYPDGGAGRRPAGLAAAVDEQFARLASVDTAALGVALDPAGPRPPG